jgi:GNAT superfamily N-acetyltransferase
MKRDLMGGPIRWRMHFPGSPERVYAVFDSDTRRAAFWAESAVAVEDHVEFRSSMRTRADAGSWSGACRRFGFVMLSDETLKQECLAEPNVERSRLMIDTQHQGHGVGRKAMGLFVEYTQLRVHRQGSCHGRC